MSQLLRDQNTFVTNVIKLLSYIQGAGYTVSFGAFYRTEAQEEEYRKLGLSHTTHSLHPMRLATDLNIFRDGALITNAERLQLFGNYWVSLHPQNRWGGDWNKDGNTKDEHFVDSCHFEMRPTLIK